MLQIYGMLTGFQDGANEASQEPKRLTALGTAICMHPAFSVLQALRVTFEMLDWGWCQLCDCGAMSELPIGGRVGSPGRQSF